MALNTSQFKSKHKFEIRITRALVAIVVFSWYPAASPLQFRTYEV